MMRNLTKETELIALVEEYQSRLTKQKETIRKLEGKIIVLEKTIDAQKTVIEAEKSQNRQLKIMIDIKEEMIEVRDLVIEELKKNHQ